MTAPNLTGSDAAAQAVADHLAALLPGYVAALADAIGEPVTAPVVYLRGPASRADQRPANAQPIVWVDDGRLVNVATVRADPGARKLRLTYGLAVECWAMHRSGDQRTVLQEITALASRLLTATFTVFADRPVISTDPARSLLVDEIEGDLLDVWTNTAGQHWCGFRLTVPIVCTETLRRPTLADPPLQAVITTGVLP